MGKPASQAELAKLAGIVDMPQYRVRAAYRSCFSGPDGKIVLEDLLKFSGLSGDLWVPGDPFAGHVIAGKIRVCQRIVKFCNMSDEDILQIATKTAITDYGD